MKFLCSIYVLIVIFAENKDKFLVRCIADLEENELVHLSQKLNALECLKLVQAVYDLTPPRAERKVKKHDALRDSTPILTSSKECLFNLEQWNNDFPINMKPNGRSAMEMTLRWLGRPDLAKYVRENHRSIKYFDTEDYDVADTLEFPGHTVSKRHTSEKDKHSRNHRRKKKKKKRHHDGSKVQNKGIQKAVAASAAHAANHKGHELKKKENRHPNKKESVSRQSICCSILFILFFVTVCLGVVYFFYKRNRSKARGTRFKHNWSNNKEDKDTFTDSLEWDDDAVCSCSDIEGGCTGKCATCSRNDQNPKTSHRTGSDDSINDPDYERKMKKKKKKKKRQRFSFLQKSFSNKKREKDEENRDRKKTLDKIIVRKHEKTPSISKKEQCACCRCAMSSRDKMLRERKESEKRELHKWRAKRKKEERRRRKEELRKIEKHANVCFNETCK